MNKLNSLLENISRKFLIVSMVGLCFGMMLVVVECTLRLIFRYSIVGGYEITQVVFSVIVFGAITYTQTMSEHINVTIFIKKLSRPVRFTLFSIMSILSTIVCGATAIASFRQVFQAYQAGYNSAQLEIPSWPFYLYESIMLFLFTLLLICESFRNLKAIKSEETAKEIQSHWS